ncbi:MAG: hypothetical protein OXO50_13780 [Caldilineaceae bacterium]|nr:hypothetical protein [Caldilineaceae bacterium]MDE0196701.1 hypothetical protein [Caldilineaceae bacterium]
MSSDRASFTVHAHMNVNGIAGPGAFYFPRAHSVACGAGALAV